VLIVDDVMTAGTAVNEVIGMIRAAGAQVAGVVIGLDRQERGQGELSAVQEVQREQGAPVRSIVGLSDIIEFLQESGAGVDARHLDAMRDYRTRYGVKLV
jgi:orotate phosphoribosyltransferase